MRITALFDLDGTISDPAEGIARSINHALSGLGHPSLPEASLTGHIGAPLDQIFRELLGTSDAGAIARAVELYRERYIRIGYGENRLYAGMREVLSELRAGGRSLRLATTKRRDIALAVLEHFGLLPLFDGVHGCDIDLSKTDLLREILSEETIRDDAAVMVGDRRFDFDAASGVGIPSIAVRWGYGDAGEWDRATAVAGSPAELPRLIGRIARRAGRHSAP
jgi:phosphoglycolate phosphatase